MHPVEGAYRNQANPCLSLHPSSQPRISGGKLAAIDATSIELVGMSMSETPRARRDRRPGAPPVLSAWE